MQYFGGKQRTATDITTVMNQMIRKDQTYFEPFVGGASICAGMRGAKMRVANDTNKYLIAMYKALQQGWVPPTQVTEDEYYAMKKLTHPKYKNKDGFGTNMPEDWNPTPAEIGFAGIACSFYGMWFGSYARDAKGVGKKGTGHNQKFAEKGHNTLLQIRDKIKDVKFFSKSYDEFNPKNALVYCDPPYSGTDQPYFTKSFDTEHFWDMMRKWASDPTNTVIISEYDAPDDFPCIVEIPTKTCIFVKNDRGEMAKADRVEKLFSQTPYDPWKGVF